MNIYFKLFLSAFLISFLGSIPVGTLNVSIVGLLINHNLKDALWFGTGAILIEVVLVRAAMFALVQVNKFQPVLSALKIGVCFVLFIFAFKSLLAAYHMKPMEDVVPFSGNYPLLAGMLLSLLNPLHLPFWIGWTAVLRGKMLLIENLQGTLIYMLAIGIGTALSFMLYGIAGSLLIDFIKNHQPVLNWVLGATMLFTGLVQLFKMFRTGSKKQLKTNSEMM